MNKKTLLCIAIGSLLLGVTGVIAVGTATFPTTVGGPALVIPTLGANDSSASIYFGDYIQGQITYSQNKLVITNDGSLPYKIFIAGTDYEIDGGVCPTTNTMSISQMDYYYDGTWNQMQRYDINQPCVSGTRCRTAFDNLIKEIQPSESIEIPFRINFPSTCSGIFTSGGLIYILTEY